jgi:hypothetical protein
VWGFGCEWGGVEGLDCYYGVGDVLYGAEYADYLDGDGGWTGIESCVDEEVVQLLSLSCVVGMRNFLSQWMSCFWSLIGRPCESVFYSHWSSFHVVNIPTLFYRKAHFSPSMCELST